MDVVRMWAGHLVRRGWRATIFLAVLVGLAAGVAMAAWAAGRRTATAFDRFSRYADAAELIVTVCPPDVVTVDQETLERCFAYDAVEEAAILNDLPEVEVAARASFRGLTAARPAAPDERWLANASLILDEGLAGFEGQPIVVAGRLFAGDSTDEVVVNERFVEQSGVAVGDELVLTFWAPDEVGTLPDEGERLHGPTARVRVVGVMRGLLDLAASTGSVSRVIDESKIIGGPALAAATAGGGGFGGVLVRAVDGDTDAVAAAVERAFEGRRVNVAPTGAAAVGETAPVREAISYEARGAMAFGAIAALAATVFVGQAVARQSRREWSDMSTLRALGMSNHDVRWAAALRGGLLGAAAAIVAVITAIALSPLGPIGVGRRAEVDPGAAFDAPVLAAGTLGVLVVVIAATLLPLRRLGRRASDTATTTRRLAVPGSLPPGAVAGLGMTVSGQRDGRGIPLGTALAGAALAVGAVVGAAGLTASLDELIDTPERFGATWDVSIAYFAGDIHAPADELRTLLHDESVVESAAGIIGTDVELGGEVDWVHAFEPIGAAGKIGPAITAGREPVAIDEIALGSLTMERLGVGIGETVEVRGTVTDASSSTMTVVGTTIVNDTYEPSPGRGGVVTMEWIETNAEEAETPDPIVVRLQPGVDVDAFITAVEDRTSAFVSPPVTQGAIRNVERIASLPFLLAALIGILAVASLAHALTLSIRRSRGQLAVWKSVGFTRGQVRRAVAWYASTLALAAIAIGVPLGLVLGRVGWQVVVEQIGVVSAPVTPVVAMVAAALGAVVVANLIAWYPAWRAARMPTAEALRVE